SPRSVRGAFTAVSMVCSLTVQRLPRTRQTGRSIQLVPWLPGDAGASRNRVMIAALSWPAVRGGAGDGVERAGAVGGLWGGLPRIFRCRGGADRGSCSVGYGLQT